MAILTCKQTCECISLQIFLKYPIQKSRDRTNPPPRPPNFESLPYPGVGGRFEIFSLKWRERMNLKVPGAILPLGCAILSTRAKTLRGVGKQPPPLGELGLISDTKGILIQLQSIAVRFFFFFFLNSQWYGNAFLLFHLARKKDQLEQEFQDCSGISFVNASRSMSFKPDGLADLKHAIFTNASALHGTYGGVKRNHSLPVIGRKVCDLFLIYTKISLHNTLVGSFVPVMADSSWPHKYDAIDDDLQQEHSNHGEGVI